MWSAADAWRSRTARVTSNRQTAGKLVPPLYRDPETARG
jgi:hypothetical protein